MILSPVHLEVKEVDKPKYHKPFPISTIYEMTLENQLKRQCKVLQKLENISYVTSLDSNMA